MAQSKPIAPMTAVKLAYELGQLKRAMLPLFWVVSLTGLSILFCGRPEFSLWMGGVLATSSIFFWWRGQMWRQGALLGAMVGTIVALLPIISHMAGLCCVYNIELELCAASGVIGGALVSTRAIKVKKSQDIYLIASGVIVTLSGALGCAVLGPSGLLGFAIGAVLVSTPIVVVAHLKPAT